ncbi:hypothetical protein KIW84_056422 [Lathyrus oleraceus]|uniref:Uncharacterized protein n=1 Tax=Pisum sativum TaxID=3888 RepID=A0A9D5AMK9_PEA|nr:hypothetical protein KIW84_056422 [Pisum sativum]
MEKNARRTLSGRGQLTVVPPSPRLVRSQSNGSVATITTPERTPRRLSSGEKLTNSHRSKSTSKIRTESNEESTKLNDKKKSNSKLLQHGVSPDRNGASKRTTLPSAWALSPGRQSLGSPIWSKSPPTKAKGGNDSSGGRVGNSVTKVLNYFKQRKVSSMQEEMYHKFKIFHNRLLQWRFINARAEVSMARVKNAAEVNIEALFEAFNTAVKVMENIEPLIKKYEPQPQGSSILTVYNLLEGSALWGEEEYVEKSNGIWCTWEHA